jgi:hypothetical protein
MGPLREKIKPVQRLACAGVTCGKVIMANASSPLHFNFCNCRAGAEQRHRARLTQSAGHPLLAPPAENSIYQRAERQPQGVNGRKGAQAKELVKLSQLVIGYM